MSAASVPSPAPEPSPANSLARLPWTAKFCLAALGAAAAALSVRLWSEWRHNPDLSHGLFMPIVFLVLLHESRRGTPRWLRAGFATSATFAGLLLGGLLALVAAGLYAASLDWTHPLVNLALATSLVLLLGAGLTALARDNVRFTPCNWSALVALGLWLLAAPIPPGTYSRLTLGLQLFVSENTVRVLHLAGIAAVRHGNIIELARATVGVEEACSGVRSLLSCVFAGLFFSATLVRRPWARALLIALSAPLALVMNFLRSLLLTLLANGGVEIAGTWHDVTGFAVLGITAAMLGGLALLLERGEKKSAPASAAPNTQPSTLNSQLFLPLAAGLALAAALVVLFALNTRPSVRRDAPVPDLLALLPATAAGWRVNTSTELYQFKSTLRTEYLAQRTYTRGTATGLDQLTLYVAYWRPGQAPVSLVASHTPDACWPGSGWTAAPAPPPAGPLITGGRTLPAPENRLFVGQFPQHVWFWHLYDGRPITYRDPYSAVELLRIAWRYGFRKNGDQLFVRVSSNRPLAGFAGEALLADFFARLQPLGL